MRRTSKRWRLARRVGSAVRRQPIPLASGAAGLKICCGTMLLSGSVAAASAHSVRPAAARQPVIRISRAGGIGPLRLNVSTAAAVERQWGAPAYTTTGNFAGSVSGYPNYTLFGYRCRRQGSYTACATNFYVSQKTQRLESFQTTSPQFVLFGGVRVGMSADAASAREHEPDVSGCGQFIHVATPRLSVDIWTRGGHEYTRNGGLYVTGGTVASIGIDDAHHGVGVLFC